MDLSSLKPAHRVHYSALGAHTSQTIHQRTNSPVRRAYT
jgi:hypothetical protein